MAMEVLDNARIKAKIVQLPEHDLESFLWVLGYAVMRHTDTLMMTDPAVTGRGTGAQIKQEWTRVCTNAFGHTSLDGIYASRATNVPLRFWKRPHTLLKPFYERYISVEMRQILAQAATFTAGRISTLIGGRTIESERLTYDTMLELLEKAVALLKGQDVGDYFWADITALS